MTSTGVHRLTMEVKLQLHLYRWGARNATTGAKESPGECAQIATKKLEGRNEAELVPYLWEGEKAWREWGGGLGVGFNKKHHCD